MYGVSPIFYHFSYAPFLRQTFVLNWESQALPDLPYWLRHLSCVNQIDKPKGRGAQKTFLRKLSVKGIFLVPRKFADRCSARLRVRMEMETNYTENVVFHLKKY